jgi:hypothetical protein
MPQASQKSKEYRTNYNKKYYQKHKKTIDARTKQWRKENPEQTKINLHNYYLKNKKRIYARVLKWRREHPEKITKYNKKYKNQ